jgi:hypothetical protein
MSEDQRPPRAFTEAPASAVDPKTAEVLRALQRARETTTPTTRDDDEILRAMVRAIVQAELRVVDEKVSQTTLVPDETVQRLSSSAQALEQSIGASNRNLFEFQRRQDAGMSGLDCATKDLRQEVAKLRAFESWWRRELVAWRLVLAFLFVVAGALAWRTHSVARETNETLLQILQNQAKAQSAKGAKR